MIGVYDQDNVNSSLSHTEAYSYDALNRLTQAVATGNSTYHLAFTYDRWGNMTCQSNGQTQGLCPQYSFSSANNRITTSGFTYDAAGDMTSDGTNTYQYDAEGKEISANGPSSWAATYNAFGQVTQRYLASQGETDSFLWDPSGRLSANWTQNHGWWWDEFVWANGAPLSDNRQLENTVWLLHADRIASTSGVSTSAGQLMWNNLYYPWGPDWAYAGSNWGFFAGMGLGWSAIGQIETPHRNYVVGPSRWLSPDPLGGDITNPQSLNRYAYALNNPTTFTDPTGLSCTDPTDPTPCINGGVQTITVTATAPQVPFWVGLFADFYLGSWPNIPINFPSPVGHPGGGRVLPPPKPASSGPLPSYWQVAKNFNQCAANVADKYSAASVLHLNNVPILESVLGSSTAAASNLVFGTRPSQYVPAGANLTAGVKAGAILAGTATAVGKFPVDQGFQSVFTTIPPTQLGETAAGSSVVKGAEGAASLLDVVVKPLVLWDELTYGYGEAACAAKSF